MNELQKKVWNKLCELDGETVARLFTDFQGNQILEQELAEYLIDEGYAEPSDFGFDECEEEDCEEDEDI